MISFNTSISHSFSKLSNFKLSVQTKADLNDKISNTANSNEILGYEIDKEGYFTDEFNKAAGIPSDYKIHSSTMQSLVKVYTQNYFSDYASIDIAKTIGNVYNIVSQILEKSPQFTGKESFSQEDLLYFPQNYEINNQGQVTQVFSFEEVRDLIASKNFRAKAGGQIFPSFYGTSDSENLQFTHFNTDILHSDIAKGRETGYTFSTTADKYTNKDGSITKGGLLIGFLSNNSHMTQKPLIEGETTIWGKSNGYDTSMSQGQINSLNLALNSLIIPLDASEDYMNLIKMTNLDDFYVKLNELKSKFSLSKVGENTFSPFKMQEAQYLDIFKSRFINIKT